MADEVNDAKNGSFDFDSFKTKASELTEGLQDNLKSAKDYVSGKLPEGAKMQVDKVKNFAGNHFSTGVIDNFKDASLTGRGLRIGGAVVGAGVLYKFGKDAIRGTKLNAETLEPEPMSFVQRTGKAILALAGAVGIAAAMTYKSAARA